MFRGFHSRLASNNSLVHHTIFDHHEAEKLSENVKPVRQDIDLERIFLEKANSLKSSEEDQQALSSFHEKVKTCILNYIKEKILFGNVVLVSCHDIGSLKMSTKLQDHHASDLMCVFSGPISRSQLDLLDQKIDEDLKSNFPSQSFSLNKNLDPPGIEVSCLAFKVKLWPAVEKIAGHDSALHLSKNILNFNKAAIKHADWFCKNNSNENVVHLVLLLKDLRKRFDGLKPLTPWLICLLAHYCVTRTTDRSSITLHAALRRCIKYLASGLFLANSVGVIDPCELGNTRAHLIMTLAEQDLVCLTAQYLANVGSILGYERILELQSNITEGPDSCMLSLAEPIQI